MTLSDEDRKRLMANLEFQRLVELKKQEIADLIAYGFTLKENQRAWKR